MFPVDISLSTIATDEGPLTAAFIRDMTERVADAVLASDLAVRRAVLGRLARVEEGERRKLAADIHDDSIQVMTAAGMRLELLRRSIHADPVVDKAIDDLAKTIQLAISRLRHFLFELRPAVLDLEGVVPALRTYIEALGRDSDTEYDFRDRSASEASEETRIVLYRIAREVLANARKHASASHVTVTLSSSEDGYDVSVEDDGVGFEYDADASPRAGHLGLAAVRERVALAGGWMELESTPGAGTTVRFWIPALPGRNGSEAVAGLDGPRLRFDESDLLWPRPASCEIEQPSDLVVEVGRREWLLDEGRARTVGCVEVLLRVSGHEENGDSGPELSQSACELDAAHARHHDVGDHEVDGARLRRKISIASAPLRARARRGPVLEELLEDVAHAFSSSARERVEPRTVRAASSAAVSGSTHRDGTAGRR